jgi:hypothetical protein
MSTTFNYIVNSVKEYCENDREINEFTTDSDYKIDTKYQRKYPIVIMSPKAATIKGTAQYLSFFIMIGDNLYTDESNLWDIWNKTLEIGKRLGNWFENVYGAYGSNYDIRIDDKKGVNFKFVSHSMDKELAGVVLEVEFISSNTVDNCFNDVPVNTYNQ